MTKRGLAALAIAAVALLGPAGPAGALGVYGSWQSSDDIDDAFGIGVKHKFQIVPIFSVDARAAWLGYGSKEIIGGEEADLSLFPLEAVGRVKLGLLYGGAGLGYYIFSGDFAPDNQVGGLGVLGAEFTLGGLGGFGELTYRFIDAEYEGADVKASGFGANLGILFGW